MYKELKGKYLLVALIVLVLVGGVVYVLQQKSPQPRVTQPQEQEQTRKEILRTLSAPKNVKSEDEAGERRQLLKESSMPQSTVYDPQGEERREMLRISGAPNK